jgi:hypothetical protein
MGSREIVGIEIVAHDMASHALEDVGGSLRTVGTSAQRAGTSVQGVAQDMELGRSKSLIMGDAVANLHGVEGHER